MAGQPGALRNLPEYSVGELSSALKRALEENFGAVRVRGEISGFKRHSSGHLYFSLKDETAVLGAVCWRGTAGRLGIEPEDGMEVVLSGRITTYALRSQYQIVVESIELAGQGALLKLIEERKRRLEAEGLFDPARKKKLPFLPLVIGVITSPTGAVIRDILHRIRERFPLRVVIWPVAVQGEGAAQQIAAAIDGFNAIGGSDRVPRPDLLIVARGGGSLEDLMAFNEEIVVRAAAASKIPLISAVGHETDTTLIDFAADLRAPTPTAAAELAVRVRAELLSLISESGTRLLGGVNRLVRFQRERVSGLARGLPDPKTLIENATQNLDDESERLGNAMRNLLARCADRLGRLSDPRRALALLLRDKSHRLAVAAKGLRIKAVDDDIKRQRRDLTRLVERLPPALGRALAESNRRLDGLGKLLESYSYEAVKKRGYAVVRDASGAPVAAAAALAAGAAIGIEFHDGQVGAVVTGESGGTPPDPAAKAGGGRGPRGPSRGSSGGGPDGRQGSLL